MRMRGRESHRVAKGPAQRHSRDPVMALLTNAGTAVLARHPEDRVCVVPRPLR